jgi:acyl-CoA reductase-like NAD-dependent aldehyde dehydrogenase
MTQLVSVSTPLMEFENEIISVNPSTGLELGRVSAMGRDGIDAAVGKASAAFAHWAAKPIRERQAQLRRLIQVILSQKMDIARLIAMEQGKPVAEALAAEILPVLAILKYLSRHAHETLRDKRVTNELILFTHKESSYRLVPHGVLAIISAWNFPFSVPLPQMAAALVAGNTVIFKPAPAAVLVGQKIAELFALAGFPERVVNTVFVHDRDAAYLTEHSGINKIIFTGSTEVGRKVMTAAAKGIKPVILELGGKDPAIVARDANIRRAAKGIVWGSMFATGQVCASIERVYVERPVAELFIEACLEEMKKLRIGNPLDEETDVGPLSTPEQMQTVADHIADAVTKGAKVLNGGKSHGDQGYFFEPTLLTKVNHSMKVMTEETFGPVLPIMVVDSLDEAIRLANDSIYGLSAYAWTASRATAERLMNELNAGTVLINDSTSTWGEPKAPWVGFKQSGIGVTRTEFGLMEMVQVKYASYDQGNNAYNPWWFPYDRSSHRLFTSAFGLLFSTNLLKKIPPLCSLLRNGKFVKTAHWGAILRHIKKIW